MMLFNRALLFVFHLSGTGSTVRARFGLAARPAATAPAVATAASSSSTSSSLHPRQRPLLLPRDAEDKADGAFGERPSARTSSNGPRQAAPMKAARIAPSRPPPPPMKQQKESESQSPTIKSGFDYYSSEEEVEDSEEEQIQDDDARGTMIGKDWSFVNRYWVFAGGGVRAVSYAGAFARLVGADSWDKPLSDRVDGAMGASAGAITAMLVCLGFTPKEILHYLTTQLGPAGLARLAVAGPDIPTTVDWASFADGPTEQDFVTEPLTTLSRVRQSFFQRYGWNTGEPVREAMAFAFRKKNFDVNLTFAQLYAKTRKELFVVTFSVAESSSFVFSRESTPNVSVRDAVTTSSSMPFYFQARFFQKMPPAKVCEAKLEEKMGRLQRQISALHEKVEVLEKTSKVSAADVEMQSQNGALISNTDDYRSAANANGSDTSEQEQREMLDREKDALLKSADWNFETCRSQQELEQAPSEGEELELRYVEDITPLLNAPKPPSNLPAFGSYQYFDWSTRKQKTVYAAEPFADGGTLDNFPLKWLMEKKPASEGNVVSGFLVLGNAEQVNWWYNNGKPGISPGKAFSSHIGPANILNYPQNFITGELTVQQYESMAGDPEYSERTVAIDTLGVTAAEWSVMKDAKMVRALVLNGCLAMDKMSKQHVNCDKLVNNFLTESMQLDDAM